jgi:hypothetical protein
VASDFRPALFQQELQPQLWVNRTDARRSLPGWAEQGQFGQLVKRATRFVSCYVRFRGNPVQVQIVAGKQQPVDGFSHGAKSQTLKHPPRLNGPWQSNASRLR